MTKHAHSSLSEAPEQDTPKQNTPKQSTNELLDVLLDSHVSAARPTRIDGVVIGQLIGLSDQSIAEVTYPNCQQTQTARSTVPITGDDIGREVALMFENANPEKPLIMGFLQNPLSERSSSTSLVAEIDNESIALNDSAEQTIEAQEQLTLRCGKASITLTKSGKIVLRGAYLSSRSSGVNRIQGGSVKIN